MSVRVLGHPVHPMLIVFPLGLLPTSVLFDILYLSTSNTRWTMISFWMIPIALAAALVAAAFGFADWLEIAPGTRAKRIGAVHGIGNVIVVGLFAVSWAMRLSLPEVPPSAAFVLSFAGVALALLTGWLGGELVDQMGVGVSAAANANAPSSLRYAGMDREVPMLRDQRVVLRADDFESEGEEIVIRGRDFLRDIRRATTPPPPPPPV